MNNLIDDCENYEITDEIVDKINMDNIDWYVIAKQEYEKNGWFTGFMGTKIHENPPELLFDSYSWEAN